MRVIGRHLLGLMLATLLLGCHSPRAAAADWPFWNAFKDGFIQDDGRVVDWTEGARTVSEGQAYALFLALVANDRTHFDRILRWTEANLAGGRLRQQLPAWLWGYDPERDQWGILDANSATDADLFIAYALLEAARLWRHPDYAETANALLQQVKAQAIRPLGERAVLLPAPDGFATEAGLRLNPSYLPPFQLHYLAQHDPEGPWSAILDESAQALSESTPHGLPPDWLLVTDAGYRPDPETGTLGSYDAIRVFLWAGFEVPGLAVLDQYQQQLRPILGSVRALGWMPERWDVASGRLQGQGPPGFQFAIAPLLRTYGAGDLAQRIQLVGERSRHGALLGQPARYYDQVLALFAEGYRERRYQFDSKGRLKLQWHRDSRS